MLVIPVQTVDHVRDGLIIILQEKQLEDMYKGHPVEVRLAEIQLQSAIPLHLPSLLVCYEDSVGMEKVTQLLSNNDLIGVLHYLQRYHFQPDKHDPQSNGDGLIVRE